MNSVKSTFESARRRTYTASRCQARFRNEAWELTFEDWCEFWPTEQEFSRRSRHSNGVCLTREDRQQGWSRTNTIKLPRPLGRVYNNLYGRFDTSHILIHAERLTGV